MSNEKYKYYYLYLYLSEYLKSLNVYDDLIYKIETLSNILNSRYSSTGKKIIINGLGIRLNNMGNEVRISKLSSGERNDFIMFFDLVFRTENHSLILIDEPEISLHVSWQETYMDDVLEALKGKECQLIIFTHSPDLVSYHNDAVINLGSDCLKINNPR